MAAEHLWKLELLSIYCANSFPFGAWFQKTRWSSLLPSWTLGVGFLRSPAGYYRGKAAGSNCYTCPCWLTSPIYRSHVSSDTAGDSLAGMYSEGFWWTLLLGNRVRVSDGQLEDRSKIIGTLPSRWDSVSIGEFKTGEIPYMLAV